MTRYRPSPLRSRVTGVRLIGIASSWAVAASLNAARPPAVVRYPASIDPLVADHAGDHPDRLARRVKEDRTRAGSREWPQVMPPRRRGRLTEYPHRAMRGVVQLSVELSDQVSVQRELGHRADPDAHDGEHHDLPDQQP